MNKFFIVLSFAYGFLICGLTTVVFWLPCDRQTIITYKTEDGYHINMRGGSPILGFSSSKAPKIVAEMDENGQLITKVLLVENTKLGCVQIIPQNVQNDVITDEHNQIWDKIEGHTVTTGRSYWGIILQEGDSILFRESVFKGNNPLQIWRLRLAPAGK